MMLLCHRTEFSVEMVQRIETVYLVCNIKKEGKITPFKARKQFVSLRMIILL